ncbi:MAG: hypothetical protein WBF67_06895 [Olleya sp.]
MPGATLSWLSFTVGVTTFSVESATTRVFDCKILLDMGYCTEVEIVVNSSNTLDTPVIQALD